MLFGTHAATLHQVQVIDLHGTRFLDLVYMHDDAPGQQRQARVSAEASYQNPQPGDPIRVTYLMGVVTGVERQSV